MNIKKHMFDKLSRVTIIALRKNIKKILFIPWVKRLFERVCQSYEADQITKERKIILEEWGGLVGQSYEADQIKKERDMFNRKHEIYEMDFTHYLPLTVERIEKLRRVINKRPVAIILHGPSLTELEERITELEDCDICYLGLNAFRVPEKNILQKINRNYSVVMCSDPVEMYEQMKNHNLIDFLERQEDNIYISERESFRQPPMTSLGLDPDKFIKQYDRKLLFFGSTFTSIAIRDGLFIPVPSIEYPLHFPRQSSFSILLSLALIGAAPMVVVFGADGGRITRRELYFRESGPSDFCREWSLMMDAKMFNLTMPLILEKIYEIYNIRPVDIVNCSVHSHYTPLKKLSYDETFAVLKSFKKGVALD